jgi:hypothetical protein
MGERGGFHGQRSGLPVKCTVGFAPSSGGSNNGPDDLLPSPFGLFLVDVCFRNGPVGFLPSSFVIPPSTVGLRRGPFGSTNGPFGLISSTLGLTSSTPGSSSVEDGFASAMVGFLIEPVGSRNGPGLEPTVEGSSRPSTGD